MNAAKFISLHVLYDCFCTTTAELSSCSRDVWPTEFSYLILYKKSLLISGVAV